MITIWFRWQRTLFLWNTPTRFFPEWVIRWVRTDSEWWLWWLLLELVHPTLMLLMKQTLVTDETSQNFCLNQLDLIRIFEDWSLSGSPNLDSNLVTGTPICDENSCLLDTIELPSPEGKTQTFFIIRSTGLHFDDFSTLNQSQCAGLVPNSVSWLHVPGPSDVLQDRVSSPGSRYLPHQYSSGYLSREILNLRIEFDGRKKNS